MATARRRDEAYSKSLPRTWQLHLRLATALRPSAVCALRDFSLRSPIRQVPAGPRAERGEPNERLAAHFFGPGSANGGLLRGYGSSQSMPGTSGLNCDRARILHCAQSDGVPEIPFFGASRAP